MNRVVACLALGSMIAVPLAAQVDYHLPPVVSVVPVFFVAEGERDPTNDQIRSVLRHLQWAQDFYRERLPGGVSFLVDSTPPVVYRASHPLSYYRERPESGVGEASGELLGSFGVNRFNSPYVFCTVWMNPNEQFPIGGGRPLNGGYNTGGGIVVMSSFAFDRMPVVQSTLRHELAHSFGLPHVDVYGYDMESNPSIMSYTETHHTYGFQESVDPVSPCGLARSRSRVNLHIG